MTRHANLAKTGKILTALAFFTLFYGAAHLAHADEAGVSKGKITITSDDGRFKMAVGGRVQADFAYYSEEKNRSGAKVGLGSGAEIRRGRIAISGTVWEDWAFKAEYDLASSNPFKDASLSYKGLKPLTFQIGNFRAPFTMENPTSSNNILFMERSMAVEAFGRSEYMGMAVKAHGGIWSAAGGLFVPDDGAGEDADDSLDIVGRFTFAPVANESMTLHSGFSFTYRDYRDDDPLGGKSARFRARPESHITGTRLASVGSFANPDNAFLYGLELAGALGPLTARLEYIGAEFETYAFTPAAGDPVAAQGYSFSGVVLEAALLLTPKDRRSYSVAKGVFGGVKPRNAVDGESGGLGAWEVALRYSQLDLRDQAQGAEQSNFSLGLNWYPNATMRFMANYIQVLDVKGGAHDGIEPSIFQIRAQVSF